ncbi:MAG: Ig-like domain-containing protein [Acetivibrio sp.]
MKDTKKQNWMRLVMLVVILSLFSGNGLAPQIQAKTKAKAIKLNKTAVVLAEGESFLLKVKVSPSKAKVTKLKFKSTDTKVARVSSRGRVVAAAPGIATIKVSASGVKSKSCKVIVSNNEVEEKPEEGKPEENKPEENKPEKNDPNEIFPNRVEIKYQTNTMTVNSIQQLGVTVYPDTAANKKVTYASSDPTVAYVTQEGYVTALKVGLTLITATTDNKIQETLVLMVKDLPTLKTQGFEIKLGENKTSVVQKMGVPQRIDNSFYGKEAYIYNGNYSKFTMIYMENDAVVGFYSEATDFECQGIKYGGITAAAEDRNDTYYLKYYVDYAGSGKITGVKVYSKKATLDTSIIPTAAMEMQVFDLTNSFRARQGIAALKWSGLAYQAAKMHSTDMGINNYFSSTDLHGQTEKDRMKKYVTLYQRAEENIIAGYGESTDTAFGLSQSALHRKNMIDAGFTHLGVGGYIGGSLGSYYTQDFYTE